MPTPASPVRTNPAAKLYGPTAIFVATILFSPLVGGAMAAINWRRAGDPRKAKITLLLGVGALAVIVAIAALAPASWGALQRGSVIGGTMGAAMGFRNEQRVLFEAHKAGGGAKASPVLIFVIGIIVLAAVIAATLATADAGA
jgi:hypothetical protein